MKESHDYIFETRRFSTLSDETLLKCSTLYSENYGFYSGKDGRFKKNQRIKMSPNLYKRNYFENDDIYISLCFTTDMNLVGHAIFLKKEIEKNKKISWVLQLVVHHLHRNRKIGTRLLQSAWGFSDYYGWGLATANAITLKTLESVTWREISTDAIFKNIETLKKIMEEVPFADSEKLILDKHTSQLFTDFYPELEKTNFKPDLRIYAKKLGEIKDGYEWLAFTFFDQKMYFDEKKFESYMSFSEQQLKDAYGRMDYKNQTWTKGTKNEVDYILSQRKFDKNAKIIDLGCGQGRHSIELASRGYNNVIGVDFVPQNIEAAKEQSIKSGAYVSFLQGDARTFKSGSNIKYDLVLCLYDVIGSFRYNNENIRILKSIKRCLKNDGVAIVSVMNMELTKSNAKHIASIKKNPEELLHLPASNTMENSGNIFNPEYYMINKDDGLVYRKEQFSGSDSIFAEYLVADKRYTKIEFTEIAESIGLSVIDSRYVSSGKWNIALSPTDEHAKEILFLLKNGKD